MNKKYIPLLLILILLLCIITGIIISNKYLDDNKVIVEDVIDNDVPKLEIDTDEDTVTEEEPVENEEIENNDENDIVVDDSEKNDTTNNSSNNSTSNNTTNNNSTSNNTTSNNKPTKPTKPTKPSNDNNSNKDNEDDKEEVVPTPPTQEQLNNEYRNTIYNTYGVKVAYGEEMGNYLVGNYTPVKMTNPDDINEHLKKIDNELKKYPTGFFKEIRDYGMNVTIYLVKDIPNSGIAGLTNSQFYSNVVISIKESLLFEKTLNHEIMHYIDAYLNSKMYPNTVETEWNMLNPTGFVYGVFDTNYDYFPNQNNNAYFFSNYSQTNYKEDRATLFEDIMTRAYKRPCYTNGYPLYSKIKLLAEQIDAGFNTVNSDTIEYWEKFIA